MLLQHWTEHGTERIVLQQGKVQLRISKRARKEEFSLGYADGSYAITGRGVDEYPHIASRIDLRRSRLVEVAAGLGQLTHELCRKYAGKDGFQRPLVIDPAPYRHLDALLRESESYLGRGSEGKRRMLLESCGTYLDPQLVELLARPVERTPFPKYRHCADVLVEWCGPRAHQPYRAAEFDAIERRILRPGGVLIAQQTGIRRAG